MQRRLALSICPVHQERKTVEIRPTHSRKRGADFVAIFVRPQAGVVRADLVGWDTGKQAQNRVIIGVLMVMASTSARQVMVNA
jgi:hypothetical protein